MEDILKKVFWGNTIMDYGIAAIGLFMSWLVLKLIKQKLLIVLHKIVSRTNTKFDDLLVEIAEKFIIPYLYLAINYNIIIQLHLSAMAQKIATASFMVVTFYYAVRMINFVIHGAVVMIMKQKNEPEERIKQLSGILVVLKVITWGMGLIMLADNMGYNVTTIIAGFGVGGIAIALAAQNILSDLFSYIVIFFDKPFEIGDMIKVGNNSGVVEKIGIKTSHVRSLDGQQLVMPNAEMVKSVIENYKRLERRRIVFSIGVVYDTPSEKLRMIPEIIQDIIIKQEHASFDRTHLKSFGDFSINYEIVYYMDTADYLLYMNTNQSICLDIFEQFEKQEIEFAFPTQTIFLNNQNGREKEKSTDNLLLERKQNNQVHSI